MPNPLVPFVGLAIYTLAFAVLALLPAYPRKRVVIVIWIALLVAVCGLSVLPRESLTWKPPAWHPILV